MDSSTTSDELTDDCQNFLSNLSSNWCFTKSDVVTCPFVWAIENFSFYLAKDDSTLHKSAQFTDFTSQRRQWYLTLECRKKNDKDQRQVLITIKMQSSVAQKVKTKIRFFFLNTRGRILIDKESEEICIFTGSDQGWSWNIPHEYLLDVAKGCPQSNDKFIIKCELNILTDVSTLASVKRKRSFEVPNTGIMENFGEMYHNQKYTDMTIWVGERQFAVHKVILASRSPVFAAMFEHHMKETVENKIVIEDIKVRVFEELLLFLYTGIALNVDRFGLDLLIAADKYGLDKLKVLCEQTVAFHLLTIESAANILVIADMHSAVQLKEYTIDYINKNAYKILATEGWKLLVQEHPKLIAQVFAKLVENVTPLPKPRRKIRIESRN